jgi:WD40 repeat protein
VDHPKVKVGADGSLLLNFGEYGQEVEVAAVSADCSRVLTVRDVGRAEVWDTGSGQQVGELLPHSPLEGSTGTAPATIEAFRLFIESAALNDDGTLALLGLNDGTAGIFRVCDGVRLNVLSPPGEVVASAWGVVRAVSWSRGGKYVLVGFSARRVGVWSEDGGQLVAMLQMTLGSALVGTRFVRDTLISSVSSSDDERFVFGGAVDMTACIWDLATGEVVFDAFEHAEEKLTLFDGPLGPGWTTTAGNVWAGAPPRRVLSTGEQWAETAVHGNRVLARCTDGVVSLWSLEGQREELVPGSTASPAGWSLSAQTLRLTAVAAAFPAGTQRVSLRGPASSVDLVRGRRLVQVELRGGWLATSGWGEVSWSSLDGRSRHSLAVPEGDGAIALSADGLLLAVGEIGEGGGRYPRRVRVYEASTGRALHELQAHDWQISKLAFSPDGLRLASLGREVRVWDLSAAAPRLAFEVEVHDASRTLQFLSDGRLLVLESGRARVFTGGIESSSCAAPFGFGTRWCVTRDERGLLLGVADGLLRVEWETGTATHLRAPFATPSLFPRRERLRGAAWGCALWRTGQGVFLHQSDGPRGWVQPMAVGFGGGAVVPTKTGAAVVSTDETVHAVQEFAFTGKLRASRVAADRVVAVNHEGCVFLTSL